MHTFRLNTNASFDDIIKSQETGITREYIYPPIVNKNSKLSRQVKMSYLLKSNQMEPFIEVKFKSRYSCRDKRLEIVTSKDTVIHIFKFSDSKHFDVDATDLSRILEEIQQKYGITNYTFKGILLINDGDLNVMKTSLNTLNINLDINRY